MLLPKNHVAPVGSCGQIQNIFFCMMGQPQDFPLLTRSLLRKLPYLSISVFHSVWCILCDDCCMMEFAWCIWMMHLEQCMMRDASCIMQAAWCMMIQNVIIKLKDYLVVTNIWGLCMMPDAFSKMHDVWWVFNDAWCIFHDKWCILHDKWCILHNAPNIHKFEDYLVLTNMWDTFMICDALSKIHDAWCILHDVRCIIQDE